MHASPGASLHHASACARCSELLLSRTRVVLPTPCPPGGLLAIGEAPGVWEDEIGEGFVGKAGQVLDALLCRNGIERNRDYGVANIVRCRPPKNRTPKSSEISNCLPWLADFLLACKPKILLLVGNTATRVFLGKASLYWHIERQKKNPILLAKDVAKPLQSSIRLLHKKVDGVLAVPMPHTSGLAWHRKAPNKKLWREIGTEQVEFASKLLSSMKGRNHENSDHFDDLRRCNKQRLRQPRPGQTERLSELP